MDMRAHSDAQDGGVLSQSERLRWLDQSRGFVMILLTLTLVFPPRVWISEGSILFWLFSHAGPDATYMTVFDIGAAMFVFIMGLSFSISFQRRRLKGSTGRAIRYVLLRYSLILIFGFLILASMGSLIYESRGIEVLAWDVIPTLGLIGFVCLPFVFIREPKSRMVAAYAWMIIYQILMNTVGLKEYAKASAHGGVFGTIFGYAGIMIVATAVGDYLASGSTSTSEPKKFERFAMFGILNVLGGLALSFVPGWEASKRQVSFTHCVISIGVTVSVLLIFIYLDRVKNRDFVLLQAYGRNPFLAYILAEFPAFVLKETVGADLGLGPLGNILAATVLLTYTSATMLYLYRRRLLISTEKVSIALLLIAVPILLFFIFVG